MLWGALTIVCSANERLPAFLPLAGVQAGAADPGSYLKKIPRNGWMCTLCGKMSKERRNMERHVVGMHTGTRDLKCHLCDRAFTTENVRQIHYRTKHALALSLKEICEMDD